MLLTLATRSPVGDLIGDLGLSAGTLLAARDDLHGIVPPEPADWRVRLRDAVSASGTPTEPDDLSQLLAICRSADSHGYRLLEAIGRSGAELRRHVIERLRAQSAAARPSAGAEASQRPIRRLRPRAVDVPTPPATEPAVVRRANARRQPRPAASPQTAAATVSRPVAVVQIADPRLHARPKPVEAPSPAAEPEPNERPTPIAVDDLPALHGRDDELGRLADALGRSAMRASLLVGAPGSGRSLLASHLARILPRPVFRLVATDYDDEDSLRDALDHIAESDGVAILDDLDRVPSEAAPPFIGALAAAWVGGSPPVLTVVSPEGHGRLGAWLPGAMESVDAITVDPLRGASVVAAVRSSAKSILGAHEVELAADAKFGELTRLADRYLSGLAMPARALDLLDLACARTVRSGRRVVHRDTWFDIVAERSGLPRDRIEVRGDQDALDLEHRLSRRIVGHAEVLCALARLVRRNRAGFGGSRPIVSGLLLGPSGVGKTELAKALAAALFEREEALVRLDMSEYAEPHAVARIVGAPPGYVGHEHGGALTDPLRARPHCVVLLDEIEKAHRDVHQLLLQVFDEGRLTDGRGRVVDFRHAAILMTSNLGADLVGPGDLGVDEHAVLMRARSAFPVELWNRIEAPLVMQPLRRAEMVKILRRLVRGSSDRLFAQRGVRYAVSDEAAEHLVFLAGRDPALGARPLRHLLTREVESAVADAILRGQLRAGTQVEAHVQRGRIVLR